MPEVRLSMVLSIHNRSELFARSLETYVRQTMPAELWEIVLVDDMSTEDLSLVYGPFLGRINLRHIKMDHTRHPIWKEMNPTGSSDPFERWYHTPALSTNLGCSRAQGTIIGLCHPEILHAPSNFERASTILSSRKEYLFGKTYLGSQLHNRWFEENLTWPSMSWNTVIHKLTMVAPLPSFHQNELYWYTSFLPRQATVAVRGVDFEYMRGVCAEDDDFRERVKQAGWTPVFTDVIQGIHQDHSHEKEKHRLRDTRAWQEGRDRNRKIFYDRRDHIGFPVYVNAGYDWTASECVVSETVYSVGSSRPISCSLGA